MRKIYKAKRAQVSLAYRQEAAKLAVKHFLQHPYFLTSEHVACYMASQEEFDSWPLMEALWRGNKKCYLPVLTHEKSLHFIRYDEGDALESNQYGIFEPKEMTKTLLAEHLDWVIMPLVAFDKAGHRLGTGGGYYDRTFAYLKERNLAKPHMMGLGYALQQAPSLPSDPWDISLEGVITEQQWILCAAK